MLRLRPESLHGGYVEKPKDLASEQHWSSRYDKLEFRGEADWKPADYDSRTLMHAIECALGGRKPTSILEVGCGNSHWLPYLGKSFGARVAGLDYSPIGCEQARAHLDANNVEGEIHCADLFAKHEAFAERFDFVYSLGLVEHFEDLDFVLTSLARFVKPGGVLFTEVPNLGSIHGLLSWVYQPAVLAKHQIITLSGLKAAHARIGLNVTGGDYVGLFSLNLVAWGVEPRWKNLDTKILPRIHRTVGYVDGVLNRVGGFDKGTRPFAPFIYVSAVRP